MKETHKIAFAFLLAAAGALLHAQTNTFPASGNVGIGTTSPSYLLDVNGAIHSSVTGGSNLILSKPLGSSIAFDNNSGFTTALIEANNGPGLEFWTNTATNTGIVKRMTIDGSGNVGIGTTSPAQRLSISSGASTRTQLLMSDGNTGSLMLAAGNSLPGVLASDANLQFRTGVYYPNADDTNHGITAMTILAGSGNVGIGTTTPGYLLDVNGTIHAQGVLVDMTGADYVFKPDYRLASLSEVEAVIKREGHLPGIPSAQEMSSRGVSVGDLQAKLLAKVEELTLHQIEQEKQLEDQAQRIDRLESENKELRATR